MTFTRSSLHDQSQIITIYLFEATTGTSGGDLINLPDCDRRLAPHGTGIILCPSSLTFARNLLLIEDSEDFKIFRVYHHCYSGLPRRSTDFNPDSASGISIIIFTRASFDLKLLWNVQFPTKPATETEEDQPTRKGKEKEREDDGDPSGSGQQIICPPYVAYNTYTAHFCSFPKTALSSAFLPGFLVEHKALVNPMVYAWLFSSLEQLPGVKLDNGHEPQVVYDAQPAYMSGWFASWLMGMIYICPASNTYPHEAFNKHIIYWVLQK
jgi:hypothetical protein